MRLIHEDQRPNRTWIDESEAMDTYLKERPKWLDELSQDDFQFLTELEDRVGERFTASDMMALYLADVCEGLDIAAIDFFEPFTALALVEVTGEDEVVLSSDLLSEETLCLLEELATSAGSTPSGIDRESALCVTREAGAGQF